MVQYSLSSLLIIYSIVTVPMMIIGAFLGSFLQPLAQYCASKVWRKVFAILDAHRAKKVEANKIEEA